MLVQSASLRPALRSRQSLQTRYRDKNATASAQKQLSCHDALCQPGIYLNIREILIKKFYPKKVSKNKTICINKSSYKNQI